MLVSKGALCARNFLKEHGFSDIIDIPIELILAGRGIYVKEADLKNADARIVFGKSISIVTINSNITYEGTKRFTLAHELGHHEMHRNQIEIHSDNIKTLSWYDTISKLKKGQQEREANEFAAELLLPSDIFIKKCSAKKFSPEIIFELSDFFKTSLTSTVFRYIELGSHPICVFFCQGGKVNYWKKSNHFNHYIIDRTKLQVPDDSVAAEYFVKGTIYPRKQAKQQIWKSTWLDLKHWENDTDYKFFEYSIVTPDYDTVLSIIWEE